MTAETKAKISATRMGKPHPHVGAPESPERREKISIARMGFSPSVETRTKLSAAGMRRIQSTETKTKISAARMGQRPSPESTAKMAAGHWRGGSAMVGERHHAKRRGLGYVYLNPWFLGCEGHHVDNEQVINMPKALHRSVYHRQTDGRGMDKINAIAYNFLFGQEVVAALKEA